MVLALPFELDALAAWMDREGLGAGPIEDAEMIAGGTQNILLRFRRAERHYVLRHPPRHKRKNSDDTMRREARVLAALSGRDVPHPHLIAACADVEPLGAAFYLMQPVDGFNPSLGIPAGYDTHEMGLAMADGIAALGRVDHVAVGLADFGKSDGWLERQVARWRAHLDGYGEAHDAGSVDDIAAWLRERQPGAWKPGIIHGDFHFANVMFRHDAPRLAALVDWELATIGDPLLDLGHLLATWPSPRAGAPAMVASGELPTADAVVARYSAGSTRDLSAIRWYHVLACYRLGIILEGTHVRAKQGLAPQEFGDALHAHTMSLLGQARELMESP